MKRWRPGDERLPERDAPHWIVGQQTVVLGMRRQPCSRAVAKISLSAGSRGKRRRKRHGSGSDGGREQGRPEELARQLIQPDSSRRVQARRVEAPRGRAHLSITLHEVRQLRNKHN